MFRNVPNGGAGRPLATSRRTTGAPRRDCGRRECDARRGSGAPPCEGGERGACAPKKREEFWNRRCRDPRLGKSATPAVPRALSRVRRSAVYWGRVASQPTRPPAESCNPVCICLYVPYGCHDMWGGYRTAAVRLSRFGPVMCDWIPPRLLLYYDFNRPSDEHSGSIARWPAQLDANLIGRQTQ